MTYSLQEMTDVELWDVRECSCLYHVRLVACAVQTRNRGQLASLVLPSPAQPFLLIECRLSPSFLVCFVFKMLICLKDRVPSKCPQ